MKLSLRNFSIATAMILLVLSVTPMPGSATELSFQSPSIIKAGFGLVQKTITDLAIKGSFLARGQYVCDSVGNPNCGAVYGVIGYDIPMYGKDTNSGSLAKYDLITVRSPFDSTATSRGLKTGTGVIRWAILNVIANPNNISIDCSVVGGPLTGTAGTLLFDNVTGTGTVVATGTPIVIGPTQRLKCGTLKAPTGSFSGTIMAGTTYSEVIN